MKLTEIDRRWGRTSRKWVWSARPRYMFEEDGTERDHFEPVVEVLPEDYEDEAGWWTCHPETRVNDLAVVYRNAGKGDPEPFPVEGPRDLSIVALITSEPFPLRDDPLAGELAKFYGCRYVVVGRFEPPVGIEALRRDPVLNTWPALRAGFVRAAMPMPNDVWQRLIGLPTRRPDTTRHPRRRRVRRNPAVTRRLEARLEDWLTANFDARALPHPLTLVGRQVYCPGHEGTADLLCRRRDRANAWVVIELKADDVRRDAIAQTLGYVAWFRDHLGTDDVTGIIIGLDEHVQVPWVLQAVEGLDVLHWVDFDLPPELRKELGIMD